MNKLNKFLLVLIFFVTHISSAMLTSNKFGTFSGSKIVVVPPVLDRGFCDHQNNLGNLRREREVLYTMAKQFSSLKKDEQNKVANDLSQQEKSMLLKKMDRSSRYQFFLSLFNQNRQVTDFCCKQNAEIVMNKYASVKRLMKDYSMKLGDRPLDVQHCMVLTEDQIKTLSDICNKKRFFNREDIEKFKSAFASLKSIDSELKCSQSFTDLIKLHPSVSERIHFFWNAQSDKLYSLTSFIAGIDVVMIAGQPFWISLIKTRLTSALLDQKNKVLFPELRDHLEYLQALSSNYPFTKKLLKICSPLSIAPLFYTVTSKFYNYKNDLAVLIGNNPSLTDALMQEQEINGNCIICCQENIKIINLSCSGGKHTDQICQECCQKLNRLCPICRGQLRDLSKLDSLFKA